MTTEGQKKIECIAQKGVYVSTPTGISMKPMLVGGRDSVAVTKITAPIKRGDVLLYETHDGHHVLHRVVKAEKEGYVMRGDNCYGKEPLLENDRIIGIMTGFWRKGKYRTSENFGYRLYGAVWLFSYPLRRFIRRCVAKLKRTVKSK